MRNPIYKPSGAAKEYGEYALNIYDGCPHKCPYCYVPGVLRKDRAAFHANVSPRPGILEATRNQLKRTGMTGQTIFLCFTCDPFPTGYDCTPTLDIIRMLKAHGNHVKILTKGDGTPCFGLLDESDWYGVTIDGAEYALLRDMRLDSIQEAKDNGIKTWASFEPVLNAEEVLSTITRFGNCFDTVKIGKLNHTKPPAPIDWAAFGREVEALCQRLGVNYYIKSSLRAEMEKEQSSDQFRLIL